MRKTIAVIGEGITEKYYIESLRGISPFQVMPKELGIKASSLKTLQKNIDLSISNGFDEIYCLIDMDGKSSGSTKNQYEALKNKYHEKTFVKRKQGTESKVCFIETERCTELWFLYYFTNGAVTRKFNNYQDLEKELKKYRPKYEKTQKYFKSIANMHRNFESEEPKGSIVKATKNAESSVRSRNSTNRQYTYSEMHLLIKALGIKL